MFIPIKKINETRPIEELKKLRIRKSTQSITTTNKTSNSEPIMTTTTIAKTTVEIFTTDSTTVITAHTGQAKIEGN